MKKKIFSKLENKYYYGISRTFWHVLIGMASLGAVIAILIIGYSYLPSTKDKVTKQAVPEKEAYPPQSEVTSSEIKLMLPHDVIIKEEEVIIESPTKNPVDYSVIDTTGLHTYEKAISDLKNVLPAKNFPGLWEGEGEYQYLNKRKWDMTRQERFRKYVVITEGFATQIKNATDISGFKKYSDKTKIIEKIRHLLVQTPMPIRGDLSKSVIKFKNRDLRKTLSSLDSLAKLVPLYPEKELLKGYKSARRFLINNPNDGLRMVGFQAKALKKYDMTQRWQANRVMQIEYSNYYNNNLTGFMENTNDYAVHIRSLNLNQLALGLEKYYAIYRSKNANRLSKIRDIENAHNQVLAEIDNKYKQDLLQAEMEYAAKTAKKINLRGFSLKGMVIALGSILFITVILLLLSMVRNVNRLAEAMLRNNHLTKKEQS